MRIFFLILIFAAVLHLPVAVFAQQGSIASVYGEALENQVAQTGGLVTCEGLDCDFCKLGEMVNNIISWLFGFLVVLAVIVFAWAGFRLVTTGGSTEAVTWSKQRFTYVVIGILLMLASWLIVDTILRGLTGQGMNVWGNFPVDQCGFMTSPRDANYSEFEISTFRPGDGVADASMVTTGSGMSCGESAPQVIPIPGEPGHRATPDTASRYVAMRDAAAADGISLRVSSSYRSEATQVEIWNRHGCNANDCTGRVARPCSLGGNGSNHSQGIALDLNTANGSAEFAWVSANGSRFGFYNRLGSRDPWHWSPSGR